jgi:ribosomal protein S2
MSEQNSVVAVYGTHVEAEEAVKQASARRDRHAYAFHRWKGHPYR